MLSVKRWSLSCLSFFPIEFLSLPYLGKTSQFIVYVFCYFQLNLMIVINERCPLSALLQLVGVLSHLPKAEEKSLPSGE